ncbi:MAG: hypothetical protein BWK74_06100 [Desulfobacteraceae bacterium A6]|nr:MAG: hypothetical protein BWK74_06100 [Desulfobacteraceae bacterium A6]
MMDSTALLMWGLLFGSIGMGYLVYGKKQRRGIALLSGVVLCSFPYFVSNVFLMILIGIIAMALPFFIKY